ncbi:hypothetical protein MAR_024969 [Mya arenaria]|uniref:Uncharacterized protein n=1 Tax=Mya arenaria TaxID=6604 RepID=A0ABY7DVF2_MYAAR|nr:hypothetical protein MAR_024969 [Mya arenaria]
MNEMESHCQYVSDVVDDFRLHKTNSSKEINDLRLHNQNMRHEIDILQSSNAVLQENVTDLRSRNMRDNLVFVGIPENLQIPSETNSNTNFATCEQTLRKFLTEHLENDPTINQNICQRGPNPTGKTRTIIAKFEKYSDREIIRKAGIMLNQKRSGHYINEHFPPEMDERRRKLIPILRQFRNDPFVKAKCYLVRDQL